MRSKSDLYQEYIPVAWSEVSGRDRLTSGGAQSRT